MSKLIPFLFVASGATVTSVGGTFLLKSTSKGNPTEQQSQPSKSTQTPETPFKSLGEFKTGSQNNACVKEWFTGVSLENLDTGVTDISTPPATGLTSTYFDPVPSTGGGTDTNSCLMIEWKKDTYTDDKWKGTFTGTGTFKNGSKGFINFGAANTNDTEQKLDMTGGFYLLEKKSDGNPQWEVKYKKEISTAQKIGNYSSDLGAHIPKAGSTPKANVENKDYGGFMDSDKFSKICVNDECKGTPTSTDPLAKKWTWKGTFESNGTAVHAGCEDFNGWSKYISSDTTLQLKTQLDKFKGNGSLSNGATA